MPLISYLCGCGLSYKKYFNKVINAADAIECGCGLKAKKVFGNISSSYKIVIDNGLMTKKIEIDPQIQEINDERSSRDYSEND